MNRKKWLLLMGSFTVMLTGCRLRTQIQTTGETPSLDNQAENLTQTTQETEALTATTVEPESFYYESEAETDIFHEVVMRSLWTLYPEEIQQWAQNFHAAKVRTLTYTTYMEDTETNYEVKDLFVIQQIFDALNQVEVGGAVTYAAQQGDILKFAMRDGTIVKFVFSMGYINVDGKIYETDNTEQLWDLTTQVIYGFEDPMTEF